MVEEVSDDSESLLNYLNSYIKKFPDIAVSKVDLIKKEEELLEIILKYHIKKGDFFTAIMRLVDDTKRLLNNDAAKYSQLMNSLKSAVESEQKLLVEFLRLKKGIQFYSINKSDKDLRFYFYSHIPEIISVTRLKNIAAEVNAKLNKKYIVSKYVHEVIKFADLTDEDQQVVCMHSQLSVMGRINALKTDSEVDEFKKEIAHRAEIIALENLKVEHLVKQLESAEKNISLPPEDIIALKRRLKEMRLRYDNLIVQHEQDIRLLDTYLAHFLRESRWRIINAFDHISDGRLYWFGEPAEKSWVYVITEDGDFIFGNRQSYLKGGFYERLPHATLARGKQVVASGEVWFVNGEVDKYNSFSGHYFDMYNPEGWVKQVRDVFLFFAKKFGLKGRYYYVSGEFPNN